MLENISVVLVETSHPGNIGSAARAMKTMGFSNLVLVKPACFPDRKAHELASGAFDLLDDATICKTLEEGVADCQLVIGMSARERDLSIPMLKMRQMAEHAVSCAESQRVALVFGRERTGLTNQELSACHYHVKIPTSDTYASLNLSQAVQILCYEVRQYFLTMTEQDNPQPAHYAKMAKKSEVDGFYQHLEKTLIKLEFINPEQPKRLIPKLKRLFNRVKLEAQEVNILRGILSAVDKQSRKEGM